MSIDPDLKKELDEIKHGINFSVPAGDILDYSSINKFGRNSDVDTADTPEDLWDGGGIWVPPTTAKLHDINSSSIYDNGYVVSGGVAGAGGSFEKLVDADATFVTDGVSVGDSILNDTNIDHSMVKSVVSETELTLQHTHEHTPFAAGDSYRVVRADLHGMSVLHIQGLDENMSEAEEFIVMDGLASVVTSRTYWRIHRMHSDGASSRSTTNVGEITATAQTDATVTAQVSAGKGQTLMAIYTVPAGKTAYMTKFYASLNKAGSAGTANVSLRQTKFAEVDGTGTIVEHYLGLGTAGSSIIEHKYTPYKRFEERTDIMMRAEEVSANDMDISGGFDLILVDN